MADKKYSVDNLFDMSKVVWHDFSKELPRNGYAYIVYFDGDTPDDAFIAVYAKDHFFVGRETRKIGHWAEWPKN